MSFADLFEGANTSPKKSVLGQLIHGIVVRIESDFVWVDAGFKSEGQIPVSEFKNANNELDVKVGDQVDVVLESIEDGDGKTILSREKARRLESWTKLEKAYEEISAEETKAKGLLINFEQDYPGVTNTANVDDIRKI